MVNKSILDRAKAFLCWDLFPDLSIQLVEIKKAVSYFYPPSNRNTIIIHYERGNPDFSIPLFFLFHEVGHYLQYRDMRKVGEEAAFWNQTNTPTGTDKVIFEKACWEKGRAILKQFVEKQSLEASLLNRFDQFADRSTESYR